MVVNTFILNIQSCTINLLLMARPLRPPLELNGRLNVGTLGKKRFQKSDFFLIGPALYPPPPLDGPAIKRRTFFAASLTNFSYYIQGTS